jgi:hypothetical protein
VLAGGGGEGAGGAGGADAVFAALQLGKPSLTTEALNGRIAMLGFAGIFLEELATGRSAWSQVFHGGIFSALGLVAAITAASVAPLVTCVLLRVCVLRFLICVRACVWLA